MKRIFSLAFTIVAFAGALAGCGEFAQRRIGGPGLTDDRAAGSPRPDAALVISNPPVTPAPVLKDPIQPDPFLPELNAPPQVTEINPLMNQTALRLLHQRAAERAAGMDAYSYRMRRRERIEDRRLPEEVLQVSLRVQPFSVRLQWLGVEAKGREMIFVKGKFNDEILALAAAGLRKALAPSDASWRAQSRYRITEMGLAPWIDRFGQLANGGSLKYLGKVKREEFAAKVDAVLQTAQPGSDPSLPKGGQRWWYFDAASGLPVLVIAHDAEGEVEYYCHDQVQMARFGDDDFNPEKVWRR